MFNNLLKIIILCVISNIAISCQAQVTHKLALGYELSIDSLNTLLKNNNFPFLVEMDTNNFPTRLYFVTEKEKKYVFQIDGEGDWFDLIESLVINNKLFFRILIPEAVVGLEYFILVKEDPFEVFLSESYNYNGEPYYFMNETINLKKNMLYIYYSELDKKEKIMFHKIKPPPIPASF